MEDRNRSFGFSWLRNRSEKRTRCEPREPSSPGHGITCQCMKKQLCFGKQAFHRKMFFTCSHLYVPWKSHTEINQFSNREKDIRGDCYLLEHESSNQLITLRDNEVKKRTWFYQHIHASMCELMEAVKKRLAHGQVRSLSFASQMILPISNRSYGSKLPTTDLKCQTAFDIIMVML